MNKPKLLAVCGPTASGKTALSLQLASRFDGEIVSCDSMQIYRGMDIGTAKPTEAEKARVAHHMIDIRDADEDYSCAEYVAEARTVITGVLARGKLPIVCGGTGLYLDSLLSGGGFAPDIPRQVLAQTEAMADDAAYAMLCDVDPESAAAIHPNNKKRVKRALALYLGTGVTKTEWDARSRALPKPYDALVLCLDFRDRGILYDRIDRRVELMLEQGLLAEAKRLNLKRESTAGQAIGYKELYAYLDGTMPLSDSVAQLKQNTRNYAKRQLTWFRRRGERTFLYPDEAGERLLSQAEALVSAFLSGTEEQPEIDGDRKGKQREREEEAWIYDT